MYTHKAVRTAQSAQIVVCYEAKYRHSTPSLFNLSLVYSLQNLFFLFSRYHFINSNKFILHSSRQMYLRDPRIVFMRILFAEIRTHRRNHLTSDVSLDVRNGSFATRKVFCWLFCESDEKSHEIEACTNRVCVYVIFSALSTVWNDKKEEKSSSSSVNVFAGLMRWNIHFKGVSKHQFRLPGIYHYGWDFHLLAIYPFLISFYSFHFSVVFFVALQVQVFAYILYNKRFWCKMADLPVKANECEWMCVRLSFTPVKALKKHKNGISVWVWMRLVRWACWKIDFGRL